MEKVTAFHEVVLNFPKEDSTEELMRLLAAGNIECARNLPHDKIPLRDRFYTDTSSNKHEALIKDISKLEHSNCYREISNGPSPQYKNNECNDFKSHHGFREVFNISPSITPGSGAKVLSEKCQPHESFKMDIANRPAQATIPPYTGIFAGAAMVAACAGGGLAEKPQNIFKAVRRQKEKLVKTLNEASITKTINHKIIEEALLAAHMSGCVSLDTSRKKPQLNFSFSSAKFKTLEDEFEVKLYLHPIFNGYVHKLFSSRICENCGRLFFYTLEKAKFCSAQCQGIAGRRRRNEK